MIKTKDKIKLSYDIKKEGIIIEKEKTNLTRLEEVKRNLLEHEEAEKRLKSWALWLAEGDEKTKRTIPNIERILTQFWR